MCTSITVPQLLEQIGSGQRPQLVDVRTASEYACGHIPSSVNIPMEQFGSRRRDLHGDHIVLVCQAGMRAQIVAGWLAADRQTRVLEGGTDAWQRNGLELVSSAKTRWSLERQVRFGSGFIVLAATLLTVAGSRWAIWLAMVVGAGLTFAGATDICMMGILLARMPWNQTKPNCQELNVGGDHVSCDVHDCRS